jgi:hypothetical protein
MPVMFTQHVCSQPGLERPVYDQIVAPRRQKQKSGGKAAALQKAQFLATRSRFAEHAVVQMLMHLELGNLAFIEAFAGA